MKDFLITLIGVSILIFTSCSKNDFTNDMPTIPASVETDMPTILDSTEIDIPTVLNSNEIDIDEDGVADYNIKYSQVIIDPLTLSSGVNGIDGSLQPYGKNEILRNREEGSLFLRNLKDIEENVVEPLKWINTFSRTIVTITDNAEGEWPDKWDINSNIEHSTYFLGLKMVSDNEIQLAWIEIDINTSDGSISIVNKGIL